MEEEDTVIHYSAYVSEDDIIGAYLL